MIFQIEELLLCDWKNISERHAIHFIRKEHHRMCLGQMSIKIGCTPQHCPINFRFPLENIISITRLFGGDNYYYFVCARLVKAVDYKFYLLRIYLRHNTHENPIILDIWVFYVFWIWLISLWSLCWAFYTIWKGFMEIIWYLK